MVDLNGVQRTLHDYSPEIDKTLTIHCYQPEPGYCACVLTEDKNIRHSFPNPFLFLHVGIISLSNSFYCSTTCFSVRYGVIANYPFGIIIPNIFLQINFFPLISAVRNKFFCFLIFLLFYHFFKSSFSFLVFWGSYQHCIGSNHQFPKLCS